MIPNNSIYGAQTIGKMWKLDEIQIIKENNDPWGFELEWLESLLVAPYQRVKRLVPIFTTKTIHRFIVAQSWIDTKTPLQNLVI
jgi:hypothetical protein